MFLSGVSYLVFPPLEYHDITLGGKRSHHLYFTADG